MMSTKKRLVKAARAGVMCVFALALHGEVQAADSYVPLEWNVGPMRSGAYREAFEDATVPAWAGVVGYNVMSNDYPAMTGLPVRSNQWFDAGVKVMQLETSGEVVTNTLAHPADAPLTFATGEPVYVDLRMKFDPLANAPEVELLANVKMALFVSADAKLVAVHNGGIATNATVLDTNKWYQVTVKLENGLFDVLLNDVEVFSDLVVKNAGPANTLTSANFYGTGLIDELYVSHGNPAYLIPGPTSAIPQLPEDGSNPPSDEEQTMINKWLNGYPAVTTLGLTQDELSMAYLLDDLNVADGTNGVAGVYSFGISEIDLISSSSLIVTARLTVNNVDKSGAINGKIQLLGKVNIGDAWTTLAGAITPVFADFTNGEATYTFSIPAGGYKFFKPLIVP